MNWMVLVNFFISFSEGGSIPRIGTPYAQLPQYICLFVCLFLSKCHFILNVMPLFPPYFLYCVGTTVLYLFPSPPPSSVPEFCHSGVSTCVRSSPHGCVFTNSFLCKVMVPDCLVRSVRQGYFFLEQGRLKKLRGLINTVNGFPGTIEG